LFCILSVAVCRLARIIVKQSSEQKIRVITRLPVVGLCGFRSQVCTVLGGPPEHTLEREQNERDVRETLGEYKCDAGMSVQNVPVIVNIKILSGRFIAQKF